MKTVEFFFDIMSPASYLAWTQLPEIAKETGASVIYRPFFLPGVFEQAKSSSPIASPNKGQMGFCRFQPLCEKIWRAARFEQPLSRKFSLCDART